MVVPVSERGYQRPQLLAETDWLSGQLDDPAVRVIDTRTEEDYGTGHIPGAVNIAALGGLRTGHGMPDADEFARFAGSLGIDADVTLVLYDDRGPSSGMTAWAFRYYGHARTRLLDGGLTKWTAEGRPLSTEVPSPAARTFVARIDEGVYCDLDQAKASVDRADAVLWDTRSLAEFDGTLGRGNAPDRVGHMPGAVHLDWVELMDAESGTLKPADELRVLLEGHGITPEAEIAAY